MRVTLQQFYIDAIAALNSKLISEDTCRAAIDSQTNDSAGLRLSDFLRSRSLAPEEICSQIDALGNRHHEVISRLHQPNSAQEPPASPPKPSDEFETFFESLETESAVPPSAPAASGETRYAKSAPHAEGGLGQVWLAQDTELHRRVALKEIQTPHADEPNFRARFLREAKITGTLEHPGVVPVYGLGAYEDGRPYYAMRFVEGETLRARIQWLFSQPNVGYRNGPWLLNLRRLLNNFIDICNTIDYAHSRGVIHRDLKPSNVMLGAYGETLVVDWGLAKQLDGDAPTDSEAPTDGDPEQLATSDIAADPLLTMQGTAVGTLAYMSPEQARSADSVGPESDIYSLGATLFHILTGNPPVGDSTHSTASSRMEDLRREASVDSIEHLRRDIPGPLVSICAHALSPDASGRYLTAGALATDIENWMADQPVDAHRESSAERVVRLMRTHPTTVGVCTVAVVLLTIATVAGTLLSNSYEADLLQRKREKEQIALNHLRQAESAIEAAEASADVELRNSQYPAALEFLKRAMETAASEPELADKLQTLTTKQDRIARLVDFYDRFIEAERLTFDDHSRRSTILFQSALSRVGVFDQVQWWTNLPVADLSPKQTHRLREDVYLGLYLLASLRLKETLPSTYTIQSFLQLSGNSSDESTRAANVIFDLMDAYRTSQGAKLGREFSGQRAQMLQQILKGVMLQRQAIDWNPANTADSYVMGCALAFFCTTVGTVEQQTFQKVLGLADAEQASLDMLNQSANLQPDHYVNQLMLAYSLWGHEDYVDAHQRYTHAIALRTEYWSGYHWRGSMLLDQGSHEEEGPERRKIFERAQRDLERSVDLAPEQWDTHKTLGDARTWTMEDLREIVPLYTKAVGLCEPLESIEDSGVESVVVAELTSIRTWCQQTAEGNPNLYGSFACAAWAEQMLGNHARAIDFAQRELKAESGDHKLAHLVITLAHLSQQDFAAARESISKATAQSNAFHFEHSHGLLSENMGDFTQAEKYFTSAHLAAQAQWQKLLSQKGLVRIAIRKQSPTALSVVEAAIQLDETDDFDELIEFCESLPISPVVRLVTERLAKHQSNLQPIETLGSSKPPTVPPLLNGGFELGLTPVWGDTLEKMDRPAWSRTGGSLAIASVEKSNDNRCLAIRNVGQQRKEQRASLSQEFPINAETRYQLQCRASSRACDEEAVAIVLKHLGSDSELTRLSLPPGNYGWQDVEVEFETQHGDIVVEIECSGRADVRLDDIAITAIASNVKGPPSR